MMWVLCQSLLGECIVVLLVAIDLGICAYTPTLKIPSPLHSSKLPGAITDGKIACKLTTNRTFTSPITVHSLVL